MAVKDAGRERTRTQLLDAVSALNGGNKSIESVVEHILRPINYVASRYEYVEAEAVRDAIEELIIAQRNVDEAIKNLRDGALLIAREE